MKEFNVKFLVFSSSCASYGMPKNLPITEDFPQLPINPYGRSKKMIEDILRDYDQAYGITSASLRYFNAAGADFSSKIGEDHKEETHLIPLIFDAAIQKIPYLKVHGTDFPTKDGSAIRDYIHVIDLADAHVKALEWILDYKKSLFLNLGSENGFSVKEVLIEAEKICKKKIPYQLASRREGDPPVLIASSQKARDLLGWKATLSLPQILESAWKWHQYLYKKQTSKQEKLEDQKKEDFGDVEKKEKRSEKTKQEKLEAFLLKKQSKKEKKTC
jgi:UDP-glucose 4-epimerase